MTSIVMECNDIINDVINDINQLQKLYKRGSCFYTEVLEKFEYNLDPINKIVDNLNDNILIEYIDINLYSYIDIYFETLMKYINVRIQSYYIFLDVICSNLDYLVYMQEIHNVCVQNTIKNLDILPNVLMNIINKYVSYYDIDFKYLLNSYKIYRYKFSTGHRVVREVRDKYKKKGIVMKIY